MAGGSDLDADSVGPVDIAVILFEGNKLTGDVAPALAELNDQGTVRSRPWPTGMRPRQPR